jgi:hypothetical protein
MGFVPELLSAVRITVFYWLALIDWVFNNKGYTEVSYFKDDLHAHVQVYSLSLIFSLVSTRILCLSFV